MLSAEAGEIRPPVAAAHTSYVLPRRPWVEFRVVISRRHANRHCVSGVVDGTHVKSLTQDDLPQYPEVAWYVCQGRTTTTAPSALRCPASSIRPHPSSWPIRG